MSLLRSWRVGSALRDKWPPHFARCFCSLEILAALLSLVRLEVDRARGADKNVRAPFAFLQTVGYCELRMCLAKSVALY